MVATALLAGGAVGLRHAAEPDHLAAVATLIEKEDRPASTGAAWGIGHSIPILGLGGVAIAAGVEVPAAGTGGFEVVVAGILIVLGIRAITGRRAIGLAIFYHLQPDDPRADAGHQHLTIGRRKVGFAHSHAAEESFAVGIIHGLAGTGIVLVALVANAGTVADGIGFLSGFALATFISMGVAAWGWGKFAGRSNRVRVVAGIVSVAMGFLLVLETSGFAPSI